MLRRLFSKQWISGKFDLLLEQASVYMAGSNSPFLVISGPCDSGKTMLSHNTIGALANTGLCELNSTISVSLKNEDYELEYEDNQNNIKKLESTNQKPTEEESEPKSKVFTFIESLFTQSAEYIEKLESEIDTTTKQNIQHLFVKTCKKISVFHDENEIESLEIILQEANKYLAPYPRVKPLRDLTEPSLLALLSDAPLRACFEFINTCLFNINIESSFGSEALDLLINLLVTINKFRNDQNKPTLLLRLDDIHFLYMDNIGRDFLINFAKNMLKYKGLGCLLVGNCQFGEVLRLLESQKESVAWMHLENYSKDSVQSLYESLKIDSKSLDQNLLWTLTGGNIYTAEEVAQRLKSGSSLDQIKSDFIESGLKSVENIFSQFTETESSLTQKIFGSSNETLRSFIYFLDNFMKEPEHSMKLKISDLTLNPIIEGLVIHGILTYNPINEILTFDKPILSEIIRQSTQYSKYSAWLQQSKNKKAYEDILAEYSSSLNKID